MKFFEKLVAKFKGTHAPIEYKSEYSFSERWEEVSKIKQEQNTHNLLLSANRLFHLVSSLVLLHKLVLIWYLSVYRLFQVGDTSRMMAISIAFTLVDVGLKLCLLRI